MDRIFLFYTLPFIISIFMCQNYIFQDCISFSYFQNSMLSSKLAIFAQHHFLNKGNSSREVPFKMWLDRVKGSGDVQKHIYILPTSENLKCWRSPFVFYSLGYYVRNYFLRKCCCLKSKVLFYPPKNVD